MSSGHRCFGASGKNVMARNLKAPPEESAPFAPQKRQSHSRDVLHPSLEFSDAGVKELIRSAKKCGHVTLAQVNAVVPSPDTSTEQLHSILSIFGEMGVNVVETNEAEQEVATAEESEEAAKRQNELVEVGSRLFLYLRPARVGVLFIPQTPSFRIEHSLHDEIVE
jgi:hypothetical protein